MFAEFIGKVIKTHWVVYPCINDKIIFLLKPLLMLIHSSLVQFKNVLALFL